MHQTRKALAVSTAVATALLSLAPSLVPSQATASDTISVTEKNFAFAETARNFRNWMNLGANEEIVHLRNFPPRGKEAPTVQMNDDTLYSVAMVEAVDGKVTFTMPEVDVYQAIQVVNEGGQGEHYIVEPGDYSLPIETDYALLIYRTGTEDGLDATRGAQDKISADGLQFGTYELPNYDFDEVEEWVARLTAETQGKPFSYTFPRTSSDITDLHQWNLENANGWGSSSPEVGVANLYVNSVSFSADECLSTTFDDPKSKFFTSFTAYDSSRYLVEDVKNVNSNTWDTNGDGTVTVSFNFGAEAVNNIDTQGNDYSFTIRYYGVSQDVVDKKITPELTGE